MHSLILLSFIPSCVSSLLYLTHSHFISLPNTSSFLFIPHPLFLPSFLSLISLLSSLIKKKWQLLCSLFFNIVHFSRPYHMTNIQRIAVWRFFRKFTCDLTLFFYFVLFIRIKFFKCVLNLFHLHYVFFHFLSCDSSEYNI